MAFPKGQPKYQRPLFIKRFWARVRIAGPDDCWLWMGSMSHGYGALRFKTKQWLAHRFAYEIVHGEGSAIGFDVLHTCDTPLCCNDRHHYLGTQTDNNKDRDARGRTAKGERHPRAKLTFDDVEKIRSLSCRGVSNTELARQFGIHNSGITRIIKGELWK